MSGLSERIAKLSPERRAVLERLLQGKGSSSSRPAPIGRRGDRTRAPLSFAQQRMWFLNELSPGNAAYHVPACWRIHGDLDAGALARALEDVVGRHEILRTVFENAGGKQIQRVLLRASIPLPVVDLSDLGEEAAEDLALRLAGEAAQPFDLSAGSPLRLRLLRTGRERHVLAAVIHHIVSDAWSVGVLFRELGIGYNAHRAGKTPVFPELAIQYGDFAQWQRERSPAEVEADLAYWKERLAGAPLVLELPSDRSRPAVSSHRGAREVLRCGRDLVSAIRKLSQSHEVTLFTTILALFQVLLHRYTGQDDLLVGTPIAGRNRLELEGLIGLFVNTLVLRADLSGDPTFRELLGRMREVTLGAYAHQELAFERLVEEIQPERELGRNPIVQAVFALQNVPAPDTDFDGLEIEPVPLDPGVSRFDLTLFAAEKGEELFLTLEYSTDLFAPESARRLLAHLEQLMEAVAELPGRRLSEIPLLTEAERRRILTAWSGAGSSSGRPAPSIPDLVIEQASLRPRALALEARGEWIDYGELDRRTHRLALELESLGVAPDVRVGVCLERSIEMVVAALATMRAGGAYVALDPSHPPERLRSMLDDAGASLVLTTSALAPRLSERGRRAVALDGEPAIRTGAVSAGKPVPISPDQLAYVIFTSGSTGRPKAVAVTHRGLSNLVDWHRETYAVTETDRATLVAGPGFDASVWEIWPYLASGASLHVPDEATRGSAGSLLTWLGERAITLSFLPTPLAEAVLEEPMPASLRLRVLLTGGDRLHRAPADRIPFRLTNHYGPTECSVVTTWCEVPPSGSADRPPPIGRPLPNVRVYVLDRHLQPAPVGVPGELYVGGEGLARGYLGDPASTAARFVPDPFGSHGQRLYRTGDRVRFLPDGNLDFLGRLDEQVKIRGFRIEPGEIESVLLDHPRVREARVLAREDARGRNRLVAYVVPEGARFEPEELELHLAERLPDYMVPSAFVPVERWPLTPNGKLDRNALPAPEDRAERADERVPPRDETERRLAAIWCELLGRESVGVHENFFDLGGDSILSLQIVSRARRAGIELTAKHIFQFQTIAELAAAAKRAAGPAAEQGAITGPVRLTPIQRWFFEGEPVDPHHFHQSVLLELAADADERALRKSFAALVHHHDALRAVFRREGAGWQQSIAPPGIEPRFTVVDLSTIACGDPVSEIARAAAAGTRLDRGAPACAVLVRRKDGPPLLLVSIHHLVVDGVSWRILLEDLEAAYGQAQQEGPVQLPPKTTSFARWAEALWEHAQSPEARAELPYWTDSKATVPRLPVERRTGANTEASAAHVATFFSSEETSRILRGHRGSQEAETTELLLAAVACALQKWSGSSSFSVDVEGHGREEIGHGTDLSRTVGWFTSVFPLRLELDPRSSPQAALAAVRRRLRGLPRKGIGYGLLRYLCEDDRVAGEMRAIPRAEVIFNYLGQLDPMLSRSRLFRPHHSHAAFPRSPRALRTHLLAVSGWVLDGRLRVDWTFSENAHRRETAERLARSFAAALRALIDAPAIGQTAPAPTVASAGLDPRDLDRLLNALASRSEDSR